MGSRQTEGMPKAGHSAVVILLVSLRRHWMSQSRCYRGVLMDGMGRPDDTSISECTTFDWLRQRTKIARARGWSHLTIDKLSTSTDMAEVTASLACKASSCLGTGASVRQTLAGGLIMCRPAVQEEGERSYHDSYRAAISLMAR